MWNKYYLFFVFFLLLNVIVIGQNCIDFTNFNSSGCVRTTGTFSNPYQMTLSVNNSSNRHVVMTNPNEKDINTGSILRTIPIGESASVRLGNSSTGAQAESISYNYQVDTSEADLLFLKYAAVLQDPNHSIARQPRLTLEILNQSGMHINGSCTFADFRANANLGWNRHGMNLWKDWTIVGVDLSQYHGQTIKVRLTTYDCAESGHYGYAYFTLSCGKKKIEILNPCTTSTTVTFSAPAGFNYQWYNEANSMISTNRTVTVDADDSEYRCVCSFVGNSSCGFEISASSLALGNNDTIALNQSICRGETTLFGFEADTSGVYVQNLQSMYGCDSTVVLDLTVHPTYNDTITAEICDNEVYTQYNFNTSEAGYHTQNLQTINGCDSIVVLNLIVHPTYNDTITAEICDNEVYTQYNFNTSEAGYHTQNLQTINGCDSIVVLNLIVHPTYNDTITAEICDNEVYTQYNFNTSEAGYHTQNLQTINGCDSIVVLNLTIHPTFSDTTIAEICSNDRYTRGGFDENTTGVFYRNLQTINGCDSIFVLDLTANPVYLDTIFAEICEGETYENFGFEASNNGIYRQYLETVKGCDSTVVLKLTVHPTYSNDLVVDICEGEEYAYNGNTYNIQGVYQTNYQTIHGCDSVINLRLNVHPKYLQTRYERVCLGTDYIDRDFHESEAGIYQVNYQSYRGCDSVIVLDLTVDPVYLDTINALINIGTFYNENGFFENERGTYTQYLSSEYGCDSTIVLVLDYADRDKPDVFSPNAINPQDEINSEFCIYPEDETVVMDELIIFNRQGVVVFQAKEFGDCWNGKYKGQYVTQGVYKYAVIYHNVATPDKKQRKVGSIMVEY